MHSAEGSCVGAAVGVVGAAPGVVGASVGASDVCAALGVTDGAVVGVTDGAVVGVVGAIGMVGATFGASDVGAAFGVIDGDAVGASVFVSALSGSSVHTPVVDHPAGSLQPCRATTEAKKKVKVVFFKEAIVQFQLGRG